LRRRNTAGAEQVRRDPSALLALLLSALQ